MSVAEAETMQDVSPLLTDLYQINMIQAYHGDTAVFELFVRSPPARHGFLLAAGFERFSADKMAWLKASAPFSIAGSWGIRSGRHLKIKEKQNE